MGRFKKYGTVKALRAAVEDYFDSITRTATVTELVPTGKVNKDGKPIMRPAPILNDIGEPIVYREFVLAPSITGLCHRLNITRDTWARYSADEKLADVCAEAKAVIEGWLEGELVTRHKGVDGIKFALENNYGWKNKHEFNGNIGGVEKFLEELPPGSAEF